VATTDTKTMIAGAVGRLIDEVPALRGLALVFRLELRERGGPATWRVQTPGPAVTRDPAPDASVSVAMDRPAFNLLAEKAHLGDWIAAYDKGMIRVTGDPNVIKLIGKVVAMRRARQK
jgi:hypothetical protein